ncbi:hypothetical protein HK098_005830 [Nowakowskiella sp. JEL0407]|nr:hypothetical protein HK098_005830 [Nowakowskiella sp. JEL0407]
MPHCGHVLYNNLLWANWNKSSMTESKMNKEAPYIKRILEFLIETPIADISDFENVLNNTSMHCFDALILESADDSVWLNAIEPGVVDSPEVI